MVWCMTMTMIFLCSVDQVPKDIHNTTYVNDLCSCKTRVFCCFFFHLDKKQQNLNPPLSNIMHITGRVWCDLWHRYNTVQPNDFHIDWIQYDANLWKQMCFTLRHFYSGSSVKNLYNLCVKMRLLTFNMHSIWIDRHCMTHYNICAPTLYSRLNHK